jgi:3-methyl-2-oxobutanoate hydroxymethyltransferase
VIPTLSDAKYVSTTPHPAGKTKRTTVREIAAMKGRAPIVCVTAYSAPMAGFMDGAVDLLLVGDSLGMVLYGMDTTLGVTLDMMIAHGQAVMRGSRRACVIVDMPFGSYQVSPAVAFKSCARVMAETGCSGVKLEGGREMVETIKFLAARGIPVMGHVGLKPQSVHQSGGYRTQGKSAADAEAIAADAEAVADAGAFAVVIEGTIETLAREITADVAIPTIGIGASPACDGQVLVAEDLLGLFSDFTPKFVKRYAELGVEVTRAVEAYAADVRARRFPGPDHVTAPKK